MFSTFHIHERSKATHERKLPSLYTWVFHSYPWTHIHTYIHRHETDLLAGPHEITWLSGCAESPGHNGRPNLLGALVSWPACTEEPINWRARLRWSTLSRTPYANYRRELGDVRRHTLTRLYSSSEQIPRASPGPRRKPVCQPSSFFYTNLCSV